MTRTRTLEETRTLDDERVALRIELHLLRERGGDSAEIGEGELRLKELSRLIAARIAGKA
ncbi:hypothetical protein ASG11_09935 [Sphingomonas sp. Leaf357]|nr:hypothetical protein ASG11_09935 [Sphingomonas sp. Leaf357]